VAITPGSTSQSQHGRNTTNGCLDSSSSYVLESGSVYGYRKIYKDLCELGETCGMNRVARLMKQEALKAQVGYNRPRYKGGQGCHPC
jgi:hypothetical protein